jgi:hypothetical protein
MSKTATGNAQQTRPAYKAMQIHQAQLPTRRQQQAIQAISDCLQMLHVSAANSISVARHPPQ